MPILIALLVAGGAYVVVRAATLREGPGPAAGSLAAGPLATAESPIVVQTQVEVGGTSAQTPSPYPKEYGGELVPTTSGEPPLTEPTAVTRDHRVPEPMVTGPAPDDSTITAPRPPDTTVATTTTVTKSDKLCGAACPTKATSGQTDPAYTSEVIRNLADAKVGIIF